MSGKPSRSIRRSLVALGILWISTILGGGCGSCGEAGELEAPRLEARPEIIVFPSADVWTKPTNHTVITNIGTAPARIKAVSLSNTVGTSFALVSKHGQPTTIEVGGTLQISVQYTPQKQGAAEGVIRIDSDAANGDSSGAIFVKVRAAAVGAELETIPRSMNFEHVRKGKIAKRELQLKNAGQVDLIFTRVYLTKATMAEGEFEIYELPDLSKPVPTDRHVVIKVGYSPRSENATGELVIESNARDRPKVFVPLKGGLGTPLIRVVPLSLSFTNGRDGSAAITIHNDGNLNLKVGLVSLTGGSSKDFTILGAPLPPLEIRSIESRTVTIQYRPSDSKPDQGRVEIHSDAENQPLATVALEAK